MAKIIDGKAISAEIRSEIKAKESASTGARKEWRAWEIVVIILGFPLWFPLLIAGLTVVFSVFLVLWAVNLVLWTIEAVFFIFALASKYMIIAFKAVSKWSFEATKLTFIYIKGLFSGR